MADEKRIQLTKDFRQIEREAGEAGIYPGMLVQLNSDNEFVKQTTEGENALTVFALEDALQGNTVDDVYTSGDVLQGTIPKKGARVQARLAAGTNYTTGTYLSPDGNGYLEAVSAASSGVTPNKVALLMEDIDLSASGAEASLAVVTVL